MSGTELREVNLEFPSEGRETEGGRERQDCNERHVRGTCVRATICLETWNVAGAEQFNPERGDIEI